MFYSTFLLKIRLVWKAGYVRMRRNLGQYLPIQYDDTGTKENETCWKLPNQEMYSYESAQEFPDTHSNTLCINQTASTCHFTPQLMTIILFLFVLPPLLLYRKSLNREDLNKHFSKDNRVKVSFIFYCDLKD